MQKVRFQLVVGDKEMEEGDASDYMVTALAITDCMYGYARQIFARWGQRANIDIKCRINRQ
jgi:hypothetical protein